jgi:hypothetical protein
MKSASNFSGGQCLVLLLPTLLLLLLGASCPAKQNAPDFGPVNTYPCKFDATFNHSHEGDIEIVRNQIAAFNRKYSIYKTGGSPAGEAIAATLLHTPHFLPGDFNSEPNVTERTIYGVNARCGLFLGFGKPSANSNAISLYLMLMQEELSRLDDRNCKVEYDMVMQNGVPVFFTYNAQSKAWIFTEKSTIDQWVANLYDRDPSTAPAFRGYYIQHPFATGEGAGDQFMYLGLKQGVNHDTLNVFSFHQPLVEGISNTADGHSQRTILFGNDLFHTSVGYYDTSTVFLSTVQLSTPNSHTTVRPCPPHCSKPANQ